MQSPLILTLLLVQVRLCVPQLDLPPVPTPSIQPKLHFNSYSADRNGSGSETEDRSMRHGPPYDDEVDEGEKLNRSARFREGLDERYDQYDRDYYNRNREKYEGGRDYDDRNRYSGRFDDKLDRDRYPNHQNDRDRYPNRDFDRERYNNNGQYPDRGSFYDDRRFNNSQGYNYDRPIGDDRRNNYDSGRYNDDDRRFNDRDRSPYYVSDREREERERNSRPYGPYSFNDRDRYNDPNYYYNIENDPKYQAEIAHLRRVLAEIDRKSSLECTQNVAAQWNFETNVNEATHLEAVAAQQRYADFQRVLWDQMRQFDQGKIFDNSLFRQVRLMSVIGINALPPDQLDRYNRIVNDQLAIFNTAEICAHEQPFRCGLKLQPHLKDIMGKSRDWDELAYTWLEWRRKTGRNMRELFEQMVDLTNDAAHSNNFTNGADYWMSAYDSPTFRRDMELAWGEVEPLYELLHSYVRRKLREFYGPDKINRNTPIPEHILGNMYGQNWAGILDITLPYPGRKYLEVTPEMIAQGYNPLVMFQLADEFYRSLNMSALPPDFWVNSILQQPPDRPILCQPSAWDFCDGVDYRIKMCTGVNHKDLITVHHEVAHLQYFLNYKDKPKVFRDGPNPSFHEAIGDAIGLSVASPRHLQTLGLVQKSVDDTAHDINFLFALAMDKVVFLPFALALEFWRYDIFTKRIRKEEYNCHWWLLREQYGGIKPPVLRSELDFDMGSKYHVPANIPYMRHFFGAILQFQLFRALCVASREYIPNDPSKPLHKCDIYRHPEAGEILKKLMEKGSSDTWQNVLQEVLGQGRLDASALREYFQPLEEWLRNENLRTQEVLGWRYDGDYCKHSIETANLQVYGGFYNSAKSFRINNFALSGTFAILFVGFCLSSS